MTREQITDYLTELENQLIHGTVKQTIQLSRDWVKQFPANAGVYLIRENEEICYVGETGAIKARMGDLLDTRNHVIRRNIGKANFDGKEGYKAATSHKKFPDAIESLLENWMTTKLTVSAIAVNLGRKELEEMLFDKYKPKYNQKGKRKIKKSRLESNP